MKNLFCTIILVCLMATGAWAASMDLAFNDESAQLQFFYPLTEDDYGATRLDARLLYNDPEDTGLISGGCQFWGSPGNVPGLQLGIGGQLIGGQTDESQDFINLGVSGKLTYAPPVFVGWGLTGKLTYAPKVFSFLDSERLWESGIRLHYAMTPRAQVFVEYQAIQNKFEDCGTWTIDEGVRVGFAAHF